MQLVRRRKRPVHRVSVSYVAVHIVDCWRTKDMILSSSIIDVQYCWCAVLVCCQRIKVKARALLAETWICVSVNNHHLLTGIFPCQVQITVNNSEYVCLLLWVEQHIHTLCSGRLHCASVQMWTRQTACWSTSSSYLAYDSATQLHCVLCCS